MLEPEICTGFVDISLKYHIVFVDTSCCAAYSIGNTSTPSGALSNAHDAYKQDNGITLS